MFHTLTFQGTREFNYELLNLVFLMILTDQIYFQSIYIHYYAASNRLIVDLSKLTLSAKDTVMV